MFGIAFALAVTVVVPQDTVVDAPAWTSGTLGVSLPRPNDDWVFVPATARGTTTVIFHPRAGALSDQLWGALVLTPWGRPVPLGEVADARVAGTWRPTYGSSFSLLTRDSIAVAGWPAIHIVMSGAIAHAVVDIEEYFIARDSDLVLLQFRLPRGVPRDTVAEAYERVLAGLRLARRGGTPTADQRVERHPYQTVVEVPETLVGVAPGSLTSDLRSGGRRTMWWTRQVAGDADTAMVIGPYRNEERRVGRLTVVVWRLPPDVAASRASEERVATLARGWALFWKAFGPVPTAELTLVETDRPFTLGATGIVFLGADADDAALLRELARTWWGGYLEPDSSLAALSPESLVTADAPTRVLLRARAAESRRSLFRQQKH